MSALFILGSDGSSPNRPYSRFSLRTHLRRILLSLLQLNFVLLPGLALKKIHNGPILVGGAR